MEELLVPGRRPFVRDFIRTVLLPARLDLLRRKAAPACLQARQCFFRRACAQLRQRRRSTIARRVGEDRSARDLLVHRAAPTDQCVKLFAFRIGDVE